MHFLAPRRQATSFRNGAHRAWYRARGPLDRYLWLCPLIALVLAAAILAALGLSLWTIVLALVLLACPLAALVAWLTGRQHARSRRPVSHADPR